MPNPIRLHWRVLCILYGSLLASIAFAVGHHLYYQSLADTPVSTANDLTFGTWTGVPSQKFNTAIGTTFASLFRTSLSITVTTAYFQIVWSVLKAGSTRLNVVDAISGILANPLAFFNGGAWKKSSLLIILAATTWLLPIAPIITPATLTVQTNSQVSYGLTNVSAVDFNSLNFASVVANSQGACGYLYRRPQFEVMKIVAAAAGQDDVLPFSAPGSQPNASYVQQFAGPALQCNDVAEPLRGEILTNVNTSTFSEYTSYGYLSWTPSDENSLPFLLENVTSNGESYSEYQLQSYALGPGRGSSTPLSLFVATFPNMQNPYTAGSLISDYDYVGNATIVKCQLKNATYASSFNWTNGIRDLNITVSPGSDGIVYHEGVDCSQFLYTPGVSVSDALKNGSDDISDYNNTIIQNFAYQSVMHAFGSIVTGSINYPRFPNGLVVATNVMDTVLGATPELLQLQNSTAGQMKGLASLGRKVWPGISVESLPENSLDLRSSLEGLFQNVTMSLMSSKLLQSVVSVPDPATPYYPPPVNVTSITYQNLYAYSATMLWLSYGVALFLALITVIVGSMAIFSSGFSYSSSFSTVLRTASHAAISTDISRNDATGQDPLPEHLCKATILFDRINQQGGESAAKEVLMVKQESGRLLAQSRAERYS
ncbi:hypothetical protein AUEXF2481DRAFT_31775 [Aureobasidium subglaciale EXF-2481]|uniref:Uncharacterized protein n=1 Tax=Aureobasidium subglaciale (strain EXF-2481) TaxID=1043005 RepID=A0A074Y5A9_AURSE|nr:uncharacterized protein AUEXF2481DRAFT_31775 [Aureobasidium subglaciale EXF-2481]KAI5199164.1 hypothetical protein E4T38_07158 [Aureobasidium subglaciale]KAI5217925.1 hypothetical protein E4T40_07149 [Aureobasidium subglaciale]KAI5221383.1 hypothetical protein E4T41_07069 [Aureobasidium subglaciale]KAI5258986.1 hypothetical protein E4T46_07066 [Aureobasidium subglaciale]KEQ92910.1 hypothetical protein AUEXF2481DRAFT_31775 [Aureobasidium subglaciale EXF-2481]